MCFGVGNVGACARNRYIFYVLLLLNICFIIIKYIYIIKYDLQNINNIYILFIYIFFFLNYIFIYKIKRYKIYNFKKINIY